MNSKDVGKALKNDVFPLLREARFSEFSTRTAWRDSADTIDVVDFRSLGYYLGSAVAVTSHSFCVTIGVYYKALHSVPWAEGPLPVQPEEWRCHARRVVRKPIFQLWCWRPDVWYVDGKGRNLAKVIAAVQRALREEALPWLDQFGDLRFASQAFESRPESEFRRGIVREMLGGGLGSFARAEVVSALALGAGDRERARRAWQQVVANPIFQRTQDLRQKAEQRLALLRSDA